MFFKKNKPPIEEWVISWLEDTYRWIIHSFGIEIITEKKIYLPTQEDFPFDFEKSESTAKKLLSIVAKQMNVDISKVELRFYNNKTIELRNDFGHVLHLENANEVQYSGIYKGLINDKHLIMLDISKFILRENIIATVAHEVSHIVLSELKNLKEYDEYLVDLLTVIYGFGIFNANVSFQFFKSNEGWGYSKQGYLRPQDWAYALALYSFVRKDNDCDWSKYLTNTIRSDFQKSRKYLQTKPFQF